MSLSFFRLLFLQEFCFASSVFDLQCLGLFASLEDLVPQALELFHITMILVLQFYDPGFESRFLRVEVLGHTLRVVFDAFDLLPLSIDFFFEFCSGLLVLGARGSLQLLTVPLELPIITASPLSQDPTDSTSGQCRDQIPVIVRNLALDEQRHTHLSFSLSYFLTSRTRSLNTSSTLIRSLTEVSKNLHPKCLARSEPSDG